MPSKPLKPCNKQGCNQLTMSTYCSQHQQVYTNQSREQSKESNKRYNKYNRDPVITSFYKSKSWESTRSYVLARDHGLCQLCLKDKVFKAADMVDHIVPVKVDWSKRLDINNLQSLCNACHNAKTAIDKRSYVGL